MSKYDLQLTEPDGTKIQYFDKCKKFIEEIVTRPHGPITREQLHFWKDPDFSPTDRYQPLFSPAVVVILIGARDLENRLNRGDEFPAGKHLRSDPGFKINFTLSSMGYILIKAL
jgi:hypothetical protein